VPIGRILLCKVFALAGLHKHAASLAVCCMFATLGLTEAFWSSFSFPDHSKESCMHNIIYIVGLVVVVLFILSMLGLR
jgi:uncharacterized membrane protein YphA (DoxX/SURF4 family)